MENDVAVNVFALIVIFGGFAGLFAVMAFLADYVLPALAERFGWEIT